MLGRFQKNKEDTPAPDNNVVHFFGDRERNAADADQTERMLDQLIAEEMETTAMAQQETEELRELVFVEEDHAQMEGTQDSLRSRMGLFFAHMRSFLTQKADNASSEDRASHNLKDASYIASSHYEEEVEDPAEDVPTAEEGYITSDDGVDYQERLHLEEEESPYMDQFPEDVLVRWEGPEYEVYPQSKQWYLVMGLLLALIVSYAIFTNSPVMAILFVLVGVVGYLYMTRAPRVMNFGVTEGGIAIGDQLIDYDEIRSFWIIYEPPHTRVISLHMQGRFLPYIHIPLHQVDPVDVHESLTQYIPEVRQEPNLVDALERVLGI